MLSHMSWCAGPYLICCCWAIVLEFGECKSCYSTKEATDGAQAESPWETLSKARVKIISRLYIQRKVQPCRYKNKFGVTLHPLHCQPSWNHGQLPPTKIKPQSYIQIQILYKASIHHLRCVISDALNSLFQSTTYIHAAGKLIKNYFAYYITAATATSQLRVT